MDPSEWTYVGEGGRHALFACHLSGRAPRRWQGRLLRVSKQDLVVSAYWSSSCLPTTAKSEETGEGEDPLFYVRDVVAPILEPFVDVPVILELEWAFLHQLRCRTIAEGRIPSSRRPDWDQLGRRPESRKFTKRPTGLLVHDYKQIIIPDAPTTILVMSNNRISFEIKPKAGYAAFSPLVHPSHRVKYFRSRFVLLQLLHQQGHLTKGWTLLQESIQMSNYDPLDLFSGDITRIRSALSALFSCPQNNLKAWYNDTTLIGHDVGGEASHVLWKEICANEFNLSDARSPQSASEPLMIEILAATLLHESLLPRLLRLQELDILDADGAILVFDRLVKLCDGSVIQAERELEKLSCRSVEKGRKSPLQASPFSLEHESSSGLPLFCDEVFEFRRILNAAAPSLPSSAQLDEFRNKMLAKVRSFSVAECHYLLANWLLSLSMCDVSVFVTFQHAKKLGSAQENADQEPHATLVHCVDKDEPGFISINVGDQTTNFVYRVRVIDCDRKPASKLKTRKAKESVFQNRIKTCDTRDVI